MKSFRDIKARCVTAELEKLGALRVNVRILETAESTNATASEMLDADFGKLPFAVIAREQTAGRGRMSRSWFSKKGASVCLSAAVRVPPDAEALESFTVRAGIFICTALRDYCGAEVFLKWPNDLYSRDGKKISGMLAELKVLHAKEMAVIFGVGINADFSRLAPSEIPEEILKKIADLSSVSARDFDMNKLCALCIDAVCRAAESLGKKGLAEDFARFDFLKGREVSLEVGGEKYSGTACGVDERGRLKVSLPDGSTRLAGGGEATVKSF